MFRGDCFVTILCFKITLISYLFCFHYYSFFFFFFFFLYFPSGSIWWFIWRLFLHHTLRPMFHSSATIPSVLYLAECGGVLSDDSFPVHILISPTLFTQIADLPNIIRLCRMRQPSLCVCVWRCMYVSVYLSLFVCVHVCS